MKDNINILFIGDVIGDPGYNLVKLLLPDLKSKYKIDFTVANGENITNGVGILEKDARKLLDLGIDVMTGGNHTLDKIQTHKFLNESINILRPLNYPRGVFGHGFGIYELKNTPFKICVANFQGRTFMRPIDCPFRQFDWLYEKISSEVKMIFVDFHAEVTAEKIALGWHIDGRASALLGTHTHIQTADARILPLGTAYITDVGMTGPYDSVIGMKKEASLKRFIYATPQKHEAAEGDVRFSGCVVSLSPVTGKALSITRLMIPDF